MRVAIFGAGGVGAYLGARLAHVGAASVHLVARGSHLEALRRDGLELRSVLGDVRVELPATADPAEIGPVDVVVFTVKSTDTDEAADRPKGRRPLCLPRCGRWERLLHRT